MMFRLKILLPLRWQQLSAPSFRCISITFTVLFTVIIVLMIIVEAHRFTIAQYNLNNDRVAFVGSKQRAIFKQPTDTRDHDLSYAVVIDCGSSGSRAFLYFWPRHTGNRKDLLAIEPVRDHLSKPINMKIEPGISNWAKVAHNASHYLAPLLKFALRHIPAERHKETLLYVFATAGMRLLPSAEQASILRNLRTDIPLRYPFVAADGHFEVITGKQEGVYTWIAINYVLKKFSHGIEDHPLVAVPAGGSSSGSDIHVRRRTVGIVDMGGASVQIAYEVPQLIQEEWAKDLMAEVNLGCKQTDIEHRYHVYVATFLGHGANTARERYEQTLIQSRNNRSSAIFDPCLPLHMRSTTERDRRRLVGTGNYTACRQSLSPLLNVTPSCARRPCTLNGAYQPTLDLKNVEMYGLSEFWYSTEDILGLGGHYDQRKFDHDAEEFCKTDWSILRRRFTRNMYPKASEIRLNLQCFKSAWMSAIMHEGFHIPRSFDRFYSVDLLNGQPVQWTLGALLHRTRYLPLQEVESVQPRHMPSHSLWVSISPSISSFIFSACILVVVVAIVIYIRHLRSVSLRRTLGLHKVPSMAYLTTWDS